jgi:hypothetical protein
MLYGRIILIGTTYFNKVVEVEGFSYFFAINSRKIRFIKIDNLQLNRRHFCYSPKVIEKEGSNLNGVGLNINNLLYFTPFARCDMVYSCNKYYDKSTPFLSKKINQNITIKFD